MILKIGSKSNSKQAIRAYRLLMGFPMEDDFSIALETATKNFQKEHGLTVDGIAGPKTLAAMVETLPDDDFETEDCPELEEAVYTFDSNGITKLDIPDDKETK